MTRENDACSNIVVRLGMSILNYLKEVLDNSNDVVSKNEYSPVSNVEKWGRSL